MPRRQKSDILKENGLNFDDDDESVDSYQTGHAPQNALLMTAPKVVPLPHLNDRFTVTEAAPAQTLDLLNPTAMKKQRNSRLPRNVFAKVANLDKKLKNQIHGLVHKPERIFRTENKAKALSSFLAKN